MAKTTAFLWMVSVAVVVLSVTIPASVVGRNLVGDDGTSAIERLETLRAGLRQAHAAKDSSAYLRDAVALNDLLNGSPNSVLQLMLAQLFAGKDDEALQSFGQFIRMGQSNDGVLGSKQFDVLRGLPRYSALHSKMIANNESRSIATRMFGLTDARLLPEDIDFDTTSKLFYITSVLKKEILAVDKTGTAHVFTEGPDKWPMMAVKVDAKRRLLWATEVALDGFSWSPKEDWSRSAILLYDLKTGKLLWRLEGPMHASLGDMALTAAGDAIVSDGDHGGVYRVRRETRQIERLDAGDFVSPQTPAVLPGDEQAFIPDYVRGIGVLNLRTKQVSWISTGGRHALSGIDGLYLSGRTLIATQNGTSPERVIRFQLDRSFSRLESESIIERATPTLGDPTHGVVVGGHFYYIANSGWDKLDEHGDPKTEIKMSEALIMQTAIQ
jgi:hypothetical protein